MDYRRYGDALILRVDPGEELCRCVLETARRESVALAEINGLGATDDFTVGVYDLQKRQFQPNRFEGPHEFTSLHGTVTEKDGAPYLHLHMSAADGAGRVVGGHLTRAVISVTAEVVMRILPGAVGRQYAEATGIYDMSFPE